ncbi:MAG: phospholipid carrier-dependent glycosyltransferase [Desulfobacterales bacterium]
METADTPAVRLNLFLKPQSLIYILTGLLALLIASIVILSWVPPVSRDALTHHLAVPKLYLNQGGIFEIPSIKFSYYPMNLDLLYMLPLYFGNDIIPKFIHFIFALLTAGLIYRYLRKRLDSAWGLLGALFFLSLPIIVKLSITVYVDLGLVFFSTASLLALLKWIESRFRFKYLLLSAVCCGLALGTKYNGLIVLFIIAVSVPPVYLLETKKNLGRENLTDGEKSLTHHWKAVASGAIFVLVALVIFSPWMIRNYSWKQNPVYPLFNKVFNSPKNISNQMLDGKTEPADHGNQSQISKKSSTRWGPFALRKVIYKESWWQIALIPVRIFFEGQDDQPKYFDGRLNPFLFLLPLVAFFRLKSDSPAIRIDKKIFGFFTIFFILYAFLQTDMRIRYIAPTIPPLVILAVCGLNNLTALAAERWARAAGWFVPGCTVLLVTLMLLMNAAYIVKQFEYVDPFSYLGGEIDRNEYIARYRPEYRAFQYANRNLPDDVKVLAIFLGNRSYYSDRELIFGDNLFKKIVKNSNSSDTIRTEIQRLGITHLLIRYDIFNRWSGVQFNEKERERLSSFLERNLNPLFSQSGYGLFGLQPGTESSFHP